MTTITASSLCAAVTTVDYRLAPSAIEHLGCEDACGVFADALLGVFPGASVTVRPASVDESRMTARGEVDGDGEVFAISVRDGSVNIGTSADVAHDADRDIGDHLASAWEVAVKAAHKLV